MDKLTHGGGVVYRPTPSGAEYLIVQSSKNPAHWVLPKGHIEAGETPEQTAVREVREETGVIARSLEPLGETTVAVAGEHVHTRFYLMRHEHDGAPDEQRQTVWLSHEAARARLSFDDQRRLLDRARTRIAAID